MSKEEQVTQIFAEVLPELDEDVSGYLCGMVADDPLMGQDALAGSVGPFLLSTSYCEDEDSMEALCARLSAALEAAFRAGTGLPGAPQDGVAPPRLLSAPISMKGQLEAVDKATKEFASHNKQRSQYNETFEAEVALSKREERRLKQEEQRFLEELERLEREERENQEAGQEVAVMLLPDYTVKNRERDIHVPNFNLIVGSLELIDSADLRLIHRRRYGLVGNNGVGKTTLLKAMAAYEVEGFPRHHRVLHVRQEVRASEKSVLEVVLASDVERRALMEEEQELLARLNAKGAAAAAAAEGGGAAATAAVGDAAGDAAAVGDAAAAAGAAGAEGAGGEDAEAGKEDPDQERLALVYERMGVIEAHSAEGRAAAILAGLGFSLEMQAGRTDALSGGWRMRVSLAAALFIEPDLLMLDEPTNHLDLEAVLWLQDYLKSYKHTLIVVSHDRAFVNEVATDVIHFHNKKLTYYRGDYNSFEGTRREHIRTAIRAYEAQQAKIQHMQEFIDKFRYNAKRASLVQSRIKELERLPKLVAVEQDQAFEFSFIDQEKLSGNILQVEGITFGYGGEDSILFRDVHFSIDLKSRIGILGANGSGKSTLLNLILDQLHPKAGFVHRHGNLRVAAFTQHHAEQFNYRLTALQNLLNIFPSENEQDMRSLLGRFEIGGDIALRPMHFLSGGQKSRVAFAVLVHSNPHVIILDEPTNHLDMGTIDALIGACQKFKGGLVCVSHDQHFITQVTNELWVVGGGQVTRFQEGFDEYKKLTLQNFGKNVNKK